MKYRLNKKGLRARKARESGWVQFIWPVVQAAIGAIGASASNKTNKDNQRAQGQALEDEDKRRKNAAYEAERLIKEYNKLRKERPGLSIQEFIQGQVQALDNPQLNEAFRNSRQEDFDQAQSFADEAGLENLQQYNNILDDISNGKAEEFVNKRNDIALSTNDVAAFDRAMQLRSPAIPAGTVRMDSQGRFVEGQRADKQVFQTAFETSEQQRALQFDRLGTILDSDRAAAERQQEKSKDFLKFTDYTGFASALAGEQSNRELQFQRDDESRQWDLITQFTNSAFSNQTAQPTPQSTQGSDNLAASGLNLAGKSIAQYYGNKQSELDRQNRIEVAQVGAKKVII